MNLLTYATVFPKDILETLRANKNRCIEILEKYESGKLSKDSLSIYPESNVYKIGKQNLSVIRTPEHWKYVYDEGVFYNENPTIIETESILESIKTLIMETNWLSQADLDEDKHKKILESLKTGLSEKPINRVKEGYGTDMYTLWILKKSKKERMSMYNYLLSEGDKSSDVDALRKIFFMSSSHSTLKINKHTVNVEMLMQVLYELFLNDKLLTDDEKLEYNSCIELKKIVNQTDFQSYEEKLQWEEANLLCSNKNDNVIVAMFGSIKKFISLLCGQNDNLAHFYVQSKKTIVEATEQLIKKVNDELIPSMSDIEVYKEILVYLIPDAKITATIDVEFKLDDIETVSTTMDAKHPDLKKIFMPDFICREDLKEKVTSESLPQKAVSENCEPLEKKNDKTIETIEPKQVEQKVQSAKKTNKVQLSLFDFI